MTNPDADLLAELNGALPPLAPGETAPVQGASREEELTVGAPATPSASQAADAVHATRSGGRGYRVVVVGEYRAESANGKGKMSKPYSIEVLLPNLDRALSVIKNKLLKPALTKKYPDFAGVRTNRIESATPLSPETPASRNLAYMDRAGLVAHILEVRAPINAAEYPDVTNLRDAIIDFTQTPKGFAEREAVRQKDRLEDAELAALNA